MLKRNIQITNYLKKAILAQVDKTIDFKNDEFYKISKENFIEGTIDPNITLKLFQKSKKDNPKPSEKEQENIDENLYVILAAKVIKTEVEGSQKKEELEDLTGIFYIPARLSKKTSTLLPAMEDNKLPWFPREILKPMIEPELAIGDAEEYDKVVSDEIYNIYQIVSWQDYINYCKKIYESTTSCEFEDNEIYNINGKKEKILLEDNVYIFIDKTMDPSLHIKKLYNNILKQDIELPLYENFIELREAEDRDLLKNTIKNRKMHCGQMGGQYGLSPSQRESLNHFNNMNDGEILAIQGPPGTGKTTLLQSVVASQLVKNAVEEKKPPQIVAASTNNQAVTNIIESFGKIVPKFNNNLETRWIEKVNGFAIYFPSKQKMKGAKLRGFQYTNNKGEYSLAEIDCEENIAKSKERFLSEMEKLFPKVTCIAERTLEDYKNRLHRKLKSLNNIQNNIIATARNLEKLIKDEKIEEVIEQEKKNIEKLKIQRNEYSKRAEFWQDKYMKIPKMWKILSWSEKYKTKISNKLKLEMNEDEYFGEKLITIELIEEYYAEKSQTKNALIRATKQKIEDIRQYKETYERELDKLEEYNIDISEVRENLLINRDKLDQWIDVNIRYVSFWLAVHYYEARWLEGENALTPKQKGTTYSNVLMKFFERLSLIMPCKVMTFYMLPKQFETYEDTFLYNTIDTLIVDEAGQVSTELAACSFALAKKAIIVGDDKQIQPVWGVERPLDLSLAIQEKVIKNEKEFEILERYGITASNSSVMKVACKASNYRKNDEKGLFLSEHRRCFDDIIQYCNELVYKSNLKPLRGNGIGEGILPKMGYYTIESKRSQKVGTSRINTAEAVGIARWILENEQKIYEYYSKVGRDKVLGVITPFKEQAKEIRRVFTQILPLHLKDIITVGTVHVFQGGERKIIILSTTYGSEDGCFFIDNNKNLMNVAVSRAEDSFLVFGDTNCLKDEVNSPSGLLRKYIMKSEDRKSK